MAWFRGRFGANLDPIGPDSAPHCWRKFTSQANQSIMRFCKTGTFQDGNSPGQNQTLTTRVPHMLLKSVSIGNPGPAVNLADCGRLALTDAESSEVYRRCRFDCLMPMSARRRSESPGCRRDCYRPGVALRFPARSYLLAPPVRDSDRARIPSRRRI